MKIENNIQQRSFRGTFYNNDLLVPVLEKANTSSKVIFSNVLRNMEKVRDNKIFELAMKDSQIGLLCKGISQDPYFIKLSDKIYEQETYGNFYKDILDEINTVLRRFYPRTRNRQEIEQEQLNPKEKPPFHLEDRFELEEESEQSKNALNIHEDLVPFENYFRDEELFDKKLDILTTYYSKYDKEDLDLAHNLMPLSDTIQHYNSLYNSYEFGRVPIKEKKIEIVGKKELPKEFPHFALDYVRDFSITEARALYDFLKKIYFNNYEDFIQKNKHLFKKINYKYVLECMSDAVVNPSKQHKSFYSPKLFRFLFKHPFERSLVVSTDISGIEHLDDYGIDFYEELSQRCNDKNEVKDIFEKCKIWASGGSREINKKMARQTLLEFGYCFFKEDKADVKNALYRTCSNAQIEQICDSIQENKVENFVDYAKSIASDLGDFNLEESIKRAEQGLVKYTNSSGETIGVFKESLKRFLAANPDGKNLVVSKSSKGDEVFEEQKVRLFMQIQKMFGNSDKAKVLYSSCQSPVKSGLTEGAMVVNDKGKILIKLFDNDY
ncbi:hypothetical protein IKQ21_05030, partial [bacterium]|nr:hypothetical protein [bacterium]